jgi:hypothetical protein
MHQYFINKYNFIYCMKLVLYNLIKSTTHIKKFRYKFIVNISTVCMIMFVEARHPLFVRT